MSALVIPFTVKAFLMNNDRIRPPRYAPDWTKVDYSALGSKITPEPFTDYHSTLGKGVHLHFILPDAFTRGVVGKDGVYAFPSVPNRCIVTRLYKDGGRINVKTSVIESDCLQKDVKNPETATVIPYITDTTTPFRFLGRVYDVSAATPPAQYLDKLTAIGGGDPMFAAYYPTCRTVFGFYDPLDDVPDACTLTYFVTGFFAGEGDPFSGVKDRAAFDAVMTENGFETDGAGFADNCVLFAQANDIQWLGPTYEYEDLRQPKGEVDVTFGGTSAEAMAAILAQKVLKGLGESPPKELERALTKLQYDLLKREKQTDGDFKIDDEIQERLFRKLDAVEEFDELTLTGKNDENDENDESGAGSFGDYAVLRRYQREIGTLNRHLMGLQTRLYFAWEMYITLKESSAPKDRQTAALAEVNKQMANVAAAKTQIKDKTAQADVQRERVLSGLPLGYALKRKTAPPFCVPKEPTVMLSGEGIIRSFVFGEDDKDGLLFCQLSTQTSPEIPIDAALALCDNLPPAKHPDYTRLLYQALLNSTLLSLKHTIVGMIAPIAVNDAPTALAQLFMDWQADYYPTDLTATLGDWTFDYGDATYERGDTQPRDYTALTGRVPLTPQALYTLTAQLNEYATDFPGVYDRIKNLPFISQSLSGFTDGLAAFRQAFQLPVEYAGTDISKQVAQCVAAERLSPSDGLFLPMRGGFVSLTKLRLIGTFGQKQEILTGSAAPAPFFPEYMTTSPDKKRGLFPLTITSALRLTAEFVSASDDSAVSSSAPDSSPICAVILPELLNNRLILYNAGGEYAGTLKTVRRDKTRKTRYLPPDKPVDTGDVLKAFIAALTDNADALPELITLIQDTLDKTLKTRETDFLWGVPLVLARLRVNAEFRGGAVFDKDWARFGQYDTGGADGLKIPLKFGNVKRVTDGVVCAFDDADNFTKCYPLWGVPVSGATYVSANSPTISVDDGDKLFTLLLAPNADANIETGLHPVITARINAAHTSVAAKIIPTAEMNPIIADTSAIRLPMAETGFKWLFNGQTADILPVADIIGHTSVIDGFLTKGGI